jgi:hypothetical protein
MGISLRAKILVGVALAVTAYVIMGPGDEQPVEVAKSDSAQPTRSVHPSRTVHEHRDPSRMLYSMVHRVSAVTSADTLFAPHSWFTPPPPPPPPPPAPVLTAAQLAALNTPTAPPLPFTYMGSYTADGAGPVFFLTQGDRVYSVRVGENLNDTYSVDSFTNGQLVMTYKPLKIQQQLTVGSAQ